MVERTRRGTYVLPERNVFPKILQRQPIIETTISKTKDGKWVVFKTTITDIKPVKYYKKVMGNSEGS